jgi:Na+/proline symporter
MFTDMIQMVLVVVLLITVTIGIIYYGGGIGEIVGTASKNAPHLFDFRNWGGIEYGLTLCIAVFASNLFHQGYWQRVYAGKDNKTLRKSLITCILIALPVMILTGFIGIISTGLGVSESPSVALFSLVYKLFPSGLIIAVFILALVLVMSTVDTLLNAMVATFTIDSQRIFKNIKKESLLTFARIITVVLILPATLIASKGYSVLYLFFVADLVCTGVFFPLFFGLFNSNLTEKIALVAAILGVISGVPFFLANKLLLAFALPVITSAVVCIIGSNIAKQTSVSKNSRVSTKVVEN